MCYQNTMDEVFFKDYLKLRKNRVTFATAVVVKHDVPISGKSGDKAIIKEDGSLIGWVGGGCTNSIVISEGLKALNSGKSKLIVIDPVSKIKSSSNEEHFQMTCHSGGSLSVYVEPIFPRPLIVVLGDSPVAKSLLNISSELGYENIWATGSNTDNESITADKILKNFDIKEINLSSPSFIIVCTQGDKDEEALISALNTSVEYVAFVGSKRKTDILKKELYAKGISQERLNSMINPAGIDIKARTPSEIALSILAEIIKVLRIQVNLMEENNIDNEESFVDPVCGMSVKSNKTNFFEFKSKNFYFCCNGCKSKFKNNPEFYLEKAYL